MKEQIEKAANEAYPVIDAYLGDSNEDLREAFIEGAEWAEKAITPTWEDMEVIDGLFTTVYKETHKNPFKIVSVDYYKEVLNRYLKLRDKNLISDRI